MKVIAGKLKGRVFNSPGAPQTHPMSDKIRGALFNMLGNLDGLIILDAFAGSGAISFEALSRGAVSAVAIEMDYRAQQAVAVNIRLLGVQDYVTLIKTNASTWLSKNVDNFDVVVLDPLV
jgi:16S rRNA (guanine966-N2)-methyltransferase